MNAHRRHSPWARVSTLIAAVISLSVPSLAQEAPSPSSCAPPAPATRLATQAAVRTIAKAPHYTQGLLIHNGRLYESAGMWGHSGVYVSALDGSQARQLAALDNDRFGEGLAIHGEHAFFLTYQAGTAYRYTLDDDGSFGASARAPRAFSYDGQGWGLTSFAEHLLFSDGSAQLRVIRPGDFVEERRIDVRVADRPLRSLNELE
ncbi:MAG: glutaminyl-peptide cyclotransferase, partial [Pseudomonadota bacterium]